MLALTLEIKYGVSFNEVECSFSFRFDDFDYDPVSVDDEPLFHNNSHHHKMAALSYTLKIPTMENIATSFQDNPTSFFSTDNLIYDFSSSTSLLPDQIPLGLCSSFLSEDTIPDSSPYSSRELIPKNPELAEPTTKTVIAKHWNMNNSRTPANYCLETGYWTTQPQKAMFQPHSSQSLELVQSAPTLSSHTGNLGVRGTRRPEREGSRLKLSEQSLANCIDNHPGISG